MADLWGQLDNEYSGAADIWDDGLVGKILLDDYFEIITSDGHLVRVWNGSSWQDAVVSVWNGSAWVFGTPRVWDGTAWS